MSEAEEKNYKRPDEDRLPPTASFDGLALGPGSQIGQFRIERELGHGGAGVVYLAQDTKLDRLVAIKSIPLELVSNPVAQSRFRREARLLASLNHPNIAAIYDIIEQDEGAGYLILEYVAGQTLAERITHGQLTLEEALSIGEQTAEAVAAAHEHGVIHRDLKPGNIKITPEGKVKVLDFGLAKAVAGEPSGKESTTTEPGKVIGTPAYMSPEQARGEPVDYRTDIWSLGVVMYEMLTGQLPFKGNTIQTFIHSILYDKHQYLRNLRKGLPITLEQTVSKMMQKEPLNRYQNIGTIINEFRSARRDLAASPTSYEKSPSIAVLPFVNMSADKEQEYFCDGMAEELINALTQIKDLRVIARTSAFSFKGKDVNVRDIGSQLNVETILEGSVRKAGDRLRITAQLVESTYGHHLWSQRYDRQMGDVFAIQDEITLSIVEKLKPKLLGQEKARLAKQRNVDLEAYHLYLKGRYFWNKRSEVDLKKAVECFKRSIEKDPDYALAYAGLAASYAIIPIYSLSPPQKTYPKAKQMALKALQIDQMLPEAYASLGFIKTWYDMEWADAERAFKRAIEHNPGCAMAHHWYSFNLLFRARFEEAVKEMEKALELDPVSLPINRELGLTCSYARQFNRAVDALKKTIELDPSLTYAHCFLGAAYLGKSMYEEALTEFEEERKVSLTSHAWAEPFIGFIYMQMGKRDEAQKVLDSMLERAKKEYISPYILACLHIVLGNNDEGFEFLEKAYEEHDHVLCWLKVHPIFESVRSDQRYTLLLRRMNLED